MGPNNEQRQYFGYMYIHSEVSAPKRFAKFGCKHELFVTNKRKNGQSSFGQTDNNYVVINMAEIGTKNEFQKAYI